MKECSIDNAWWTLYGFEDICHQDEVTHWDLVMDGNFNVRDELGTLDRFRMNAIKIYIASTHWVEFTIILLKEAKKNQLRIVDGFNEWTNMINMKFPWRTRYDWDWVHLRNSKVVMIGFTSWAILDHVLRQVTSSQEFVNPYAFQRSR
jgi:hypothetical protein